MAHAPYISHAFPIHFPYISPVMFTGGYVVDPPDDGLTALIAVLTGGGARIFLRKAVAGWSWSRKIGGDPENHI